MPRRGSHQGGWRGGHGGRRGGHRGRARGQGSQSKPNQQDTCQLDATSKDELDTDVRNLY